MAISINWSTKVITVPRTGRSNNMANNLFMSIRYPVYTDQLL